MGFETRAFGALLNPREGVDELRGVQHLDRQPAADLHLLRVLRVEGRVRSEAR
jgi:hypothetical protein